VFTRLALNGSRPKRAASSPIPPSKQDVDLAALNARYVPGELSVEDFEERVAEALRKPARGEQQAKSPVNTPTSRPIEPSRYDERWEIHVHDAPAGTLAAHPPAVTPNRLAGGARGYASTTGAR